MGFVGRRAVTPLYRHMLHASRPTLGFVGIQLSVPCPIPFFECQAAYIAEAWARSPTDSPLSTREEREAWVAERVAAVAESGREQDMHYTNTFGDSAWQYMRDLVHALREAKRAEELEEEAEVDASWLERPTFEKRLTTVEDVYKDRGARYPKLPWHDDAYRRCEYSVDWEAGTWSVDDSRAGQAAVVEA